MRKQFIYRVASTLTRVDQELDSAEVRLLEKLRLALGLSLEDAKAADIDMPELT